MKKRRKEIAIPFYKIQTVAFLNEAKAANFSWSDMAVLVRKRDQAATIASSLQENDIPFVSSESLSLESSMHVNFLISLIRLVLHPKDYEERKKVIAFLYLENGKNKKYDVLLNDLIFSPFSLFQKSLTTNLDFYLTLIIFRKTNL